MEKFLWSVLFALLVMVNFIITLIAFVSQEAWAAFAMIAVGLLDYLFYKKAPVYIKF